VTVQTRPERRNRAAARGNGVYAAPSRRHGTGVFAGRAFRRGQIVEYCPVLVVPESGMDPIEATGLRDYLYEFGDDYALALGLGSLYNHSSRPAAEVEARIDERLLVVRALRAIAPGEEITISYAATDELWFRPDE
jgi:hypothetical protein